MSSHRKGSKADGSLAVGKRTLVLDNGADRLKLGFAGEPGPRHWIPNCTAKLKGQVHVSIGLCVLPLLHYTAHSSPIDAIWSQTVVGGRRDRDGEQHSKLDLHTTFRPGLPHELGL